MKFKALVAGLLAAILTLNIFTAYTLINKQKEQMEEIEGLYEYLFEIEGRIEDIAIKVKAPDGIHYSNEYSLD